MEEASLALRRGGRLIINATKGNKYGKLPSSDELEKLGFKVIQEKGELLNQFKGQKFNRVTPRTDGTTEIPASAVKSTILEKI